MKLELTNRFLLFSLMLLLAASTFLQIGTPDASAWLHWANRAQEFGLVQGYALNGNEYPPLMTTLLFLSAKLAALIGWHSFFGIKLTLFIFLISSTAIIYHWSKRDIEFTFFCYLGLWLISLCLSYVDILFCVPVLLAFYFISMHKTAWAVFCFSLAVFIKYPPLIIAPLLAVYFIDRIYNDKKSTRDFINTFITTLAVPALLVLLPIVIVFGISSFFALERSFREPMLSAQALNINWVITRLLQIFPDGTFSPSGWHDNARLIELHAARNFALFRFIVAVFYLSIFIRFLFLTKNTESLLLYCMLAHMSYFMFNHGVHENHLFLSCILAIALTCINPRFKPLAMTLLIISSLNLIAFYGVEGNKPYGAVPDWYEDVCRVPLKAICEVKRAYKPYVDLRFVLAIFNSAYFFYLWFNLVCKNKIPAQICTNQS